MLFDIFIQVLGFLGILLAIISVQFNSHKSIVLCKTLAEVPYLIQYVFLGAWVGMIMGIIGIIRNLIFRKLVSLNKNTKPYIIFFCFITLVAGLITIALSWKETIQIMGRYTPLFSLQIIFAIIFSSLSIFAKIISTIAYGIKEPKTIRTLNMPSSISWLIYNLVFFSIAGVIHEIMTITSIIVATIRYRNTPKISE